MAAKLTQMSQMYPRPYSLTAIAKN